MQLFGSEMLFFIVVVEDNRDCAIRCDIGSEMLFFIVVMEDNRDCAIRWDMAWTTRILHLSVCYFLSSNIMAVFINVKNYDHSCLFRTIAQVLGTIVQTPGTNRPWVGVPIVQVPNVLGTNSPDTDLL